jgi:hypothetical protein
LKALRLRRLQDRQGLDFGPDDTWEDGAPIVVPERKHEAHPDEQGMVLLDAKAFAKSAEALEKHWPPDDSR